MTKKSNEFLNKHVMLKDVLNGLSPITVVSLMVYAIFSVIGTFSPIINPEHRLESDLTQILLNSSDEHSLSYIFACNSTDIFPFAISFIIAIFQFSFLHRKDYCYTLLSFGIKRKKLYNNRLTLPLVTMIITTLIIKGIALGLNIYYKSFDTNIIKAWLLHVIIYLQIILVIYAITVFCCHFCGRTVEAIAASLSILILPFGLSFLSQQVFSFSLYGYDGYSENFFTKALEFVNPICLEDYELTVSSEPYHLKGRIIATSVWIAIAVAILFVTKKHFEKRYKPETSGFKGAKTGIVYVISLSVPLLFSYFGFEMVRGYFYPLINQKITTIAIISTVLLGFAGALLCNFVIHFTFKRFKVALIAGCSITLIIGVISLIGLTGIFGTFNTLPTVSEIESISISHPFSNFLPTTDYTSFLDNHYPTYGSTIMIDSPNDIELVLDIHKNILEDKKTESVSRIEIQYTLKNGESVHREYTYLSNSTIEKTLALWESDASRNIIKGYLLPEDNYIITEDMEKPKEPVEVVMESSKIEFKSKYNVQTDVAPSLTKEQSYELRKAVLDDLLLFDTEEWFRPTAKSLGKIIFTTYLNQPVCIKNDYENSNTHEFFITIPIYDSMKKTIAVLEKYDLTQTLTEEKEIKKIYVADFQELKKWNCKNFNTDNVFELTQPLFNSNFLFLINVEPYDNVPIKEVTDKKEIQKYFDDGYTHYLIGNNNATYVMVEFKDSTADDYQGSIFMIPKK